MGVIQNAPKMVKNQDKYRQMPLISCFSLGSKFLQFIRFFCQNCAANLAEAPGGSRRLGVSPDCTKSPGLFVFSWETEISDFLSKNHQKDGVNDEK